MTQLTCFKQMSPMLSSASPLSDISSRSMENAALADAILSMFANRAFVSERGMMI